MRRAVAIGLAILLVASLFAAALVGGSAGSAPASTPERARPVPTPFRTR